MVVHSGCPSNQDLIIAWRYEGQEQEGKTGHIEYNQIAVPFESTLRQHHLVHNVGSKQGHRTTKDRIYDNFRMHCCALNRHVSIRRRMIVHKINFILGSPVGWVRLVGSCNGFRRSYGANYWPLGIVPSVIVLLRGGGVLNTAFLSQVDLGGRSKRGWGGIEIFVVFIVDLWGMILIRRWLFWGWLSSASSPEISKIPFISQRVSQSVKLQVFFTLSHLVFGQGPHFCLLPWQFFELFCFGQPLIAILLPWFPFLGLFRGMSFFLGCSHSFSLFFCLFSLPLVCLIRSPNLLYIGLLCFILRIYETIHPLFGHVGGIVGRLVRFHWKRIFAHWNQKLVLICWQHLILVGLLRRLERRVLALLLVKVGLGSGLSKLVLLHEVGVWLRNRVLWSSNGNSRIWKGLVVSYGLDGLVVVGGSEVRWRSLLVLY